MNEVFWLSWKEKEKELKRLAPTCNCNGGRKQPDKSYHYALCPYMRFWDLHFLRHWKAVETRKLLQTTMGAFLK